MFLSRFREALRWTLEKPESLGDAIGGALTRLREHYRTLYDWDGVTYQTAQFVVCPPREANGYRGADRPTYLITLARKGPAGFLSLGSIQFALRNARDWREANPHITFRAAVLTDAPEAERIHVPAGELRRLQVDKWRGDRIAEAILAWVEE